MKLWQLSPLKGIEAIEFYNRYTNLINKDVESLPCGCMYICKDEISHVYVNLCVQHFLKVKVQEEFVRNDLSKNIVNRIVE